MTKEETQRRSGAYPEKPLPWRESFQREELRLFLGTRDVGCRGFEGKADGGTTTSGASSRNRILSEFIGDIEARAGL